MMGEIRVSLVLCVMLGLQSFGATLHVSLSGSHTPPFSS